MMDTEMIKSIWPIAAGIVAIYIRLEVGQTLNRWRMKSLEDSRDKDLSGLHSRVGRHETQTEKMLGEIRQDIKEILRLSNK